MAGTRVFVYGSLKRGQRNHHYLDGQLFLGEATTLPRYRLFDYGPYPFLVEAPQRGEAVKGEVWEVSDTVLLRLDELEEAPSLYQRGEIALHEFAPPVLAYFYRGDTSGLRDCG